MLAGERRGLRMAAAVLSELVRHNPLPLGIALGLLPEWPLFIFLLLWLSPQNFLKRAELREYEKERDTRLASDVRTRGRL